MFSDFSRDIFNVSGFQLGGTTTITFSRSLVTGDKMDVPIILGDMDVIVAMSSDGRTALAYHGANKEAAVVNFEPGGGDMVQVTDLRKFHGIVMTISWAGFALVGIFIARFFKQRMGNWWFRFHVFLQTSAVFCSLCGFMIALVMTQSGGGAHFAGLHQIFGLTIIILSFITPIGGQWANIVYNPRRKSVPFFPGIILLNVNKSESTSFP